MRFPAIVRPGWKCSCRIDGLWLLALSLACGAAAIGVAASRPSEGGAAGPLPSLVVASSAGHPSGDGRIRYSRDIRRLLSDRCFQCHGPDGATREADLRLDEAASAIAPRAGGPAIVPGDADGSQLCRRINSHDSAEVMPPLSANKRPLSADEKQMLRAWIEQGAAYEPHWAFVLPLRHLPPPVGEPSWCRNPIDRFILASLESAGTTPSPEADRASVLRRVFLDLTGLPPTPEELEAFLADTRPDAYERWVDRLLTQEPYRMRLAERLAVPWLDAARYADTCGIHTDNGRQMWLWRDWVLRALRDNMPYDRFLTEQLAGDLLPGATIDQLVATGFNRNHVSTDEGGAIAEEYLVEYAVDRASTTASVFMGVTMGCARCHDHKFDPITQEDFYAFYAFFNSIDEPGLYSQTADPRRAYEPFITVPTTQQQDAIAALDSAMADAARSMTLIAPDEAEQRAAFLTTLLADTGVNWLGTTVVQAAASDPATKLEVQPDGFVLATGTAPATEEYSITLRAGSADATADLPLRLLLLESTSPDGDNSKAAGRNFNGNAVLTGVSIAMRADGQPGSAWTDVPLRWAWADLEQADGDHAAVNVLDTSDREGWAIAGHQTPGKRLLLVLTDQPFTLTPEGHVRVTLGFNSVYREHSLARVRLSLGGINEGSLARLPAALGRWQVAGPFTSPRDQLFDKAFGPESGPISALRSFGDAQPRWKFDPRLVDSTPVSLGDGTNVFYVGRTVYTPSARSLDLSLGSDDGFRLFANGVEATSRDIERGVMSDQDRATIQLSVGANTLVLKVVNTGGASGYYTAVKPAAGTLPHDLVAGLLPAAALSQHQAEASAAAWRRAFLPAYGEAEARQQELVAQRKVIEEQLPRTMVMKELAMPRPTFILTRGQYDKPDETRPVQRAVPKSLGALPAEAPRDRLGLARWLTSADNPLTARVAVNRFWEMLFGAGLVRTSEDFGLQGEWPTHPELLDSLAVEFREGGWNVHSLLRTIVTSATYRQSSRIRTDLAETDPVNRLLSYYPRRRLGAEQVRDLALYTSGLMIEQLGGESVKTYQPEGLWQEVAMPASNTRVFARGGEPELWRRSLYTYWKRACPPPSMQMLDAPTRESCVIRRPTTNTPLQALVMWNDEQFVEAARALAQRALLTPGDDEARLTSIFLRCTSREPDSAELELLGRALGEFRERFAATPRDAALLVTTGASALPPELGFSELAAWTMVASSVLNLHETITQD